MSPRSHTDLTGCGLQIPVGSKKRLRLAVCVGARPARLSARFFGRLREKGYDWMISCIGSINSFFRWGSQRPSFYTTNQVTWKSERLGWWGVLLSYWVLLQSMCSVFGCILYGSIGLSVYLVVSITVYISRTSQSSWLKSQKVVQTQCSGILAD